MQRVIAKLGQNFFGGIKQKDLRPINKIKCTEQMSPELIISLFDTLKLEYISHYENELIKAEKKLLDTQQVNRLCDQIYACMLTAHDTILKACAHQMLNLELRDTLDLVKNSSLSELKIYIRLPWSDNALRLKARYDRQSLSYVNGKLSSMEFILRDYYKELLIKDGLSLAQASSMYQQKISLYRDEYMNYLGEESHGSNYFLRLGNAGENADFDSEFELELFAIEDASIEQDVACLSILSSMQAYFQGHIEEINKDLQEHSMPKPLFEYKLDFDEAVKKEVSLALAYEERFNMYARVYNASKIEFNKLCFNEEPTQKPKLEDYALKLYLSDKKTDFRLSIDLDLDERIHNDLSTYLDSNDTSCFDITLKQIRSYYQEEIIKLISIDMSMDKKREEQMSLHKAYEQMVIDYHSRCTSKIIEAKKEFRFEEASLVLNSIEDYAFGIHPSFEGLDKLMVLSWAQEAALANDLSLYNLERLRIKASEFISTNCLNGDIAASSEEIHPHEVSIVVEEFAMYEQRILNFVEQMAGLYIQTLYGLISEKVDAKEWTDFDNQYMALLHKSYTTYYNNSFETAGVQKQAGIDKAFYSKGEDAPYFTKMRIATQQKIHDVNNYYTKIIENAKKSYIDNGNITVLKTELNILRSDVDRLVSEHHLLASQYKKEFDATALEESYLFEKGKYYEYLQGN